MSARRLAIVGAGPVGLAAALAGLRRGFDVQVLEQRDAVGGSPARWGDTRLFSPLEMNVTPDMVGVLGAGLPPWSALLTGPQFTDEVLAPLASSDALSGRIATGTRVVAIGRSGMRRGDYPGHPVRDERPYRLLVEGAEGERSIDADAVLDASGVIPTPWIGAGGLPAKGERAVSKAFSRDLGALHARLPALAGRRVLLVGHGHSAAHALAWLRSLAEVDTTVVWATRSGHLKPCVDVALDPLPERARVVAGANRLAASPPPWLRVERRAQVEGVTARDGRFVVDLAGGRQVVVDHIVGLVGYRPDLSFLTELALEVSPVTEGVARLARALANVTDCLSVPAVDADDLDTGEAGFHLVGAKSYGRSPSFLLRAGYAQLDTILDRLARH